MAITTWLTERLGLRHPIIQAPMANAAGGALAREVARGGGLGMVGTGSRFTPDQLDREWSLLHGAPSVGIGLLSWALPHQADLFAHCLQLRPAALLFSFGDPTPFIPAAKAAGIPVLCQVQTVEDARIAVTAGADVLVGQGTEAGGHIGSIGTLPLFTAVRQALPNVPIVLAGGVANAYGLVGALAMGGAGVMMGTRYLATPESLYADTVKKRVVDAGAGETVVTSVFDIVQGIPWPPLYGGRVLVNQFTDRWHGREDQLRANLSEARSDYQAGAAQQDPNRVFIYAGQAVGMIDALEPAYILTERIGSEAAALLDRSQHESEHKKVERFT